MRRESHWCLVKITHTRNTYRARGVSVLKRSKRRKPWACKTRWRPRRRSTWGRRISTGKTLSVCSSSGMTIWRRVWEICEFHAISAPLAWSSQNSPLAVTSISRGVPRRIHKTHSHLCNRSRSKGVIRGRPSNSSPTNSKPPNLPHPWTVTRPQMRTPTQTIPFRTPNATPTQSICSNRRPLQQLVEMQICKAIRCGEIQGACMTWGVEICERQGAVSNAASLSITWFRTESVQSKFYCPIKLISSPLG